jgi:hypothetical protein
MSRRYRELAQDLIRSSGGIGSVSIAAQQPGVGTVSIYGQQPGVGALGARDVPNMGMKVVDYTGAAYNSGGLTYCGFGSTSVPAGSTGFQVHIDVRRPFLPQLLYMPSTRFGLQIVDFVVEGNGLFANPARQGVPNELVSEVSNIEQIQWITLNPDTGGDFFIDNPTGAAIIFSGAFWGTNVIRNR